MKKTVLLLLVSLVISVSLFGENDRRNKSEVIIRPRGSRPSHRSMTVPVKAFLENNVVILYFNGKIPEASLRVYNSNANSALIDEILSSPDCWITEIPLEENNEYTIEIQIGSQIYFGEFDISDTLLKSDI